MEVMLVAALAAAVRPTKDHIIPQDFNYSIRVKIASGNVNWQFDLLDSTLWQEMLIHNTG